MGISAAFMLPHPPLIVPEIGRGEEQKISKTVDAYHEAARKIAAHKPETVIVISPHQTMYADYFHISPGSCAQGDFGRFGAPHVTIQAGYDTQLVQLLCRQAGLRGLPAGTDGERDRKLDHGTMVPLYFAGQYWKHYRLVRIGLSGLSLKKHYELGQCIREAVAALGRRTVLIASGDLSHRLKADGPYGFSKEGPEYDRRVMDVMKRAAFGELLAFPEDFCEKAAECGHRSFTILAGALDGQEVLAQKLSYEGPFGVGYGICTYEVRADD
jgi:AmmeMemoRadiSam system protein B